MTHTTPRIDPKRVAQAVADAGRALAELRVAVQQMLAAYTQAATAMRAALPAEPAREDGHTGACDATSATDAPGAADEPNGPQTGAQDRDEWAAIIAAEVDAHEAADRLISHLTRQQNRP